MKNTKNSTRMVHNAIINSERFDRIAPGEYRLKVTKITAANNPVASMSSALFPPKNPVQ